MRRLLHARLLASALAVSVVPFVATTLPATAQDYGDVSFDSFHDALAQYGYWGYSDRWGLVWQPGNVDNDFRPYYSGGHWVYTDDYGWYWDSAYPWGDIAFHYGRWVNDPDSGWLWIPGYTWSPGWVDWRSNGQYIGWMPAPPDQAFLEGRGDVSFGISFGGVSLGFNNDPYYGYRSWYGRDFDDRRFADNWVFVGTGHMADRDYRSVIVRDPGRVMTIIRQTRNVTHYTVVNNYVVNRSIDVRVVQRAAGHPIDVVSARSVIRQPNLVMRADAGQRIQMRERMNAPRGNGFANSAPPPPAAVVSKLSPNVPQHNGGTSQHLFSKTTIANPETQSHFHGAPVGRAPEGGPSGMGAPGGMNGPGHMNGPGGQPAGENTRRDQGPQGAGPGGMNGPGNPGGTDNNVQPGGENRHRDQGPQGAGPGGMNGPGNPGGTDNNTQPPGETRHRDQGSQGAGPGGMNVPGNPGGTDNNAQPGGENRHRDQGPQGAGSGGMNGPANRPPVQTTEPRHRAPTSTNPEGMTAPSDQSPAPTTEPRHRTNPNPEGTTGPGSMNGPGSGSPPPADTGRRTQAPPPAMSGPKPAPAVQPPPAAPGTPPPEKKKHKPDEPPPGTPQ